MGQFTHPEIPRRRGFLFTLLEELPPLRLEARNRRNDLLYNFSLRSHNVTGLHLRRSALERNRQSALLLLS